jgi:PLP dependent protein
MSVKENLLKIKKELPSSVTLIAVSKTKSKELITEAYEAGQKDFGENYVQELTEKHEHLPKDIRWHFIGHLQSNKVKYIAPFVYMIHGIDSFKLLKEINKEAKKNNRIINCLLQLFIAKEETKFGLSFEEASIILKGEELKQLENISIKGFMAMASNTDKEEQIREEFRSVKTFAANYPQLNVLSYGMSSDLKIAIEEGSTMVRIGSSIFGERNYIK